MLFMLGLLAVNSETALLIGLGVLILLGVFALVYLQLKKTQQDAQAKGQIESLSRELSELRREQSETKLAIAQSQLEGLKHATEAVSKQVGESIRTLNDSLNQNLSASKVEIKQTLDSTQKVVATVNEQLGALGKTAEGIQKFGTDLKSLHDVLQAPKLRGNFGEFLLQELLKNMLPPDHYDMPHSFSDGTLADAAVRLAGKRIAVDSKFPLESFRRMMEATDETTREIARKEFVSSVRVRVDEIADKYIRPDEGTYEFALMYLPSEAIYYEIVVREQNFADARSPLQYALSRKVIPVSPSSFYAYLATIAFGLRGMQIEKQAEEIRGRVGKLQFDFARFLDSLRGVDKNLDVAKRKFDEILTKGTRLQDRMSKISGVNLEENDKEMLPPIPPILDIPSESAQS